MSEEKKTDVLPSDVSINLDSTPILYTDRIGITVNSDGVVMDVMQRIGPTNKSRIVSRIGMSKEHAKKFINELSRLLTISQSTYQKNKKPN